MGYYAGPVRTAGSATSGCAALLETTIPRVPVTFTGAIGKAVHYALRLIIRVCVRLKIHHNVLTFTGVVINVAAGWALSQGRFLHAFWIILVANFFVLLDGKVATETGAV